MPSPKLHYCGVAAYEELQHAFQAFRRGAASSFVGVPGGVFEITFIG